MNVGRLVEPDRSSPYQATYSAFPAKAETQIHPERLVGFTLAPAFAGEADVECIRFDMKSRASAR